MAAPLRRQPDPHRHPQRLLQDRACRTRTAACAASGATSCRSSTCARPAWSSPREMVIRASKEKLRIAEFPIEYHPRGGESKLSSFRDGWRHLRFLLVHSPTHLFMVPGLVLTVLGALIAADGRRADQRLRPRVEHPHDGRRRADDDRRHAGRRPRPLRPRLRHLLHGRDATRGSTACARASGSSTGCCSAARCCSPGWSLAAVIVITWIDRGFGELSEERLAVLAAALTDHGPPGLLQRLPAEHPRPAPPVVKPAPCGGRRRGRRRDAAARRSTSSSRATTSRAPTRSARAAS